MAESTYDPLRAIIGAWAEVGDEAIDAFDAEINRLRSQPPHREAQVVADMRDAQEHPFFAPVGGWAGMGDDGIDTWNDVIAGIRSEPGRDVRLGNEEREQP